MTGQARGGLDEIDRAILEQVRALYTRVDPPPADLTDRVRFAIALDDADVVRLARELVPAAPARGAEPTRTLVFSSDNRTVMLVMTDRADDRVRLDGWFAPPAPLPVRLRRPGTGPGSWRTTRMAVADASGRFVLDRIRRGRAQLLVYDGGDRIAGPARILITPTLVL